MTDEVTIGSDVDMCCASPSDTASFGISSLFFLPCTSFLQANVIQMSSSIVPADNLLKPQPHETLHSQEAAPTAQTRDDKQQWIHNLPNEILIYLFKFVHAMASPAHTRQMRSNMSQRAELKTASVCRQLRFLALAQSDLWTTLCVPLTREVKNRQSAVNMCFQRSKAQLMYVWLTVFDKVLPMSITLLLDILSHYSNHMHYIGLFFGYRAVKEPIEKEILQWNLESLESSELHCDPSTWEPLPQCDIAEEYLQRLKYLRSSATTFFRSDRLIFFRLLTVLYLDSYRRDNSRIHESLFFHIMGSPNLITLSVERRVFYYEDDGIRPDCQVVAQNLKHFRSSDPSVTRWMWKDVTFSNLELLVLEDPYLDDFRYPFDINVDYADQSLPILAPRLHTLALTECKVMGKFIASEKAFASATAAVAHLIIIDRSQWRATEWGVQFSRLSSKSKMSFFFLAQLGNYNLQDQQYSCPVLQSCGLS
jgi:hypothetical protein